MSKSPLLLFAQKENNNDEDFPLLRVKDNFCEDYFVLGKGKGW